MKLKAVIGLMSGTSMDGIDTSLVYTNGKVLNRTQFTSISNYSDQTNILLNEAVINPINFLRNKKKLKILNNLITTDHALAVKKIINKSSVIPFLIGFHGQTIYHDPSNQVSYQVGDGKLLSKLLGINVVYNFRSNDLMNKGQGAPIAPIYHKYLLEKLQMELPATIVNIGGICNLSYWDGKKIMGFDTGPGNNLMDHYMKKKFNLNFDYNGLIASKGKINFNLINKYIKDLYYLKKPPKSIERQTLFKNKYLKEIYLLDSYECMATLCALTSKTLEIGIELLPEKLKSLIIVGGGQKNKFLVDLIKKTKISNSIYTGEQIGLDSDFIEAELIAFLAARKIYNLPSTFPTTTGVLKKTILGDLIECEV